MVRKLGWWFYPLCFFSFRHRSLFLLSNFVAFLRTKKCIWYRRRNLVLAFIFEKFFVQLTWAGVIYLFLCNLKFKWVIWKLNVYIFWTFWLFAGQFCNLNGILWYNISDFLYEIWNRNYQIIFNSRIPYFIQKLMIILVKNKINVSQRMLNVYIFHSRQQLALKFEYDEICFLKYIYLKYSRLIIT